MRQILLFGAGKSSAVLIHYLLQHALADGYELTVADASLAAAKEKVGQASHAKAIAVDITQDEQRKSLICNANIVISLLPPALHILVAEDCLHFRKHLLTASYIDDDLRMMAAEIKKEGLLFLCEMGLDPGIDHMSAKQLIDEIHDKGGRIRSFLSHCGGLVAPESDDNPWHYKVSWNPRNIVMAGKAGAIYKQEGQIKELEYESLFKEKRFTAVPDYDAYCWYPNRDSLSYIPKYGLEGAETFIRTTLRHPDFIYGWKNVIDLKLTDEFELYETNGLSLMQFFKEHMDKNGFSEWLEAKLYEQFDSTKTLLTELVNLVNLEKQAADKGMEPVEEFMMVNDKGDLQKIDIDELKVNAASALADRMHNANLTLKQLFFLGMDDDKTAINRGRCSAAEVLQFALEQKLMLQPEDKDRVVMFHEIEYEKDGRQFKTTSAMVEDGINATHTAMAKTVGLPLAVAARLLLNGKLVCTGLQIPVLKNIYEPVLRELKTEGISFAEETIEIAG